MATSDLKAHVSRESRSWNRPDADRCETCGTALLERETECPPRLNRRDLKDPEGFHRRLVEWLMKQR
jgi:hypothetical protein